MNFDSFLDHMRERDGRSDRLVHLREESARGASFTEPASPLPEPLRSVLADLDIDRLYSHQAEALDAIRKHRDTLVATGTASGKSLCYILPVLERLLRDASTRALLVFPTKALCQDQFKQFRRGLDVAGLDDVVAGVYDGDTSSEMRRKLRDSASVIFTNPDMLHASLMPQHGRWAGFLRNLSCLVLDEIHTYNGIFGSNMANLMRRFWRVCDHYGSADSVNLVACSATIANPADLARRLTGRPMEVISADGSPRGRRFYALWNPPPVRGGGRYRRRSANVEAHELMAELVKRQVPTITFSKARVTAEMIYRYTCETLREEAPHLVKKVSAYRGGYHPEERREIEDRLFSGELLGVSTTPALELGIDVSGLDAAIVVGYPGTLASFFQQAGRAGRGDRDALVVLVGLDTAINQYIMSRPDYLFGRPVEEAVIDPGNPTLLLGHLRCAAQELPLSEEEVNNFGSDAPTVVDVLEENEKLHKVDERWHHSAPEIPQHELSMRYVYGENVLIEDAETGEAIEQVDKIDAPPLVHPEAIYLRHGETWRIEELDLERNIARARRVDADYYTQALGGADVHHVDHRLRRKQFRSATACHGEVTACDVTWAYEKIHFYRLEAISRHGLDLPRLALDTAAFWIIPPEDVLEEVRQMGLDVHSGLRGIGYATRMLLPLFITCDTYDFSHTIGSANSPWCAIFVYERYPHGMGFTRKAYERLEEIIPAVLRRIKACDCEDGCPCCVGKPLRKFDTWNVERGEGSVPCKEASRRILEGLLAETPDSNPVDHARRDTGTEAGEAHLRKSLRRRLERGREPKVFHPINPEIETGYPEPLPEEEITGSDAGARRRSRREFHRELDRRIARKIPDHRLSPTQGKPGAPEGMKRGRGEKSADHYPGRPAEFRNVNAPSTPRAPGGERNSCSEEEETGEGKRRISTGDRIAARARRRLREKEKENGDPGTD
ncbi:MAG: DEAD/DEAH box helicase [Candidatus Brocadiia bacterium]